MIYLTTTITIKYSHNKMPRYKIPIQNFNLLRLNRMLLDVSFIVENKIIPAHRVVLAAASPVFRAMFTNWHGKQNITINNYSNDSFLRFIDYIYGIPLPLEYTDDNIISILDVLRLLKYYQVLDMDALTRLIEHLYYHYFMYIVVRKRIVPIEILNRYIYTILELYDYRYEDTPYVNNIAVLLSRYDLDLSGIPDDVIIKIIDDPSYQPDSEMMTFELVDDLVAQGRSQDLYGAVAYKYLKYDDLITIPREIRKRYKNNKKRPSVKDILDDVNFEEVYNRNRFKATVKELDRYDTYSLMYNRQGDIIKAKFKTKHKPEVQDLIYVYNFEGSPSAGIHSTVFKILDWEYDDYEN